MARAISLRALLQTFPHDLLAEYFRSRGLDLGIDWSKAGKTAVSGAVGRLPDLARRQTRRDLAMTARLAADSAAVAALDTALREHFSWDDLPRESSPAARVLWALMHDPEALRRARKAAGAGEAASVEGAVPAAGSGFQFTVTYIPEQNLFTAQGAVQPTKIIAFPGLHDRSDRVMTSPEPDSFPALTEAEIDCLRALAASSQRPMSLAELMAAAGYSKGTTRTAVARLRRLGFITRPPGTQRKGDLITPQGMAFLAGNRQPARAS